MNQMQQVHFQSLKICLGGNTELRIIGLKEGSFELSYTAVSSNG